ncbi:stathmin-4-like [Syngnathoides biaculeatus]|uniref:stathmin-4-like n=1 Tax=Syngnathoides biaculeatus TaxID=300417 RepID=UPI002ADE7272|nr:stathmin-4-like [Syngnathoides biaculeatus]
MTFAAHREKLRELPLVSLLCSCIVQNAADSTAASAEKEGHFKGTVDLKLGAIRHLEVTEVSGHAGGRAFQVILKPPSFGDVPPKAIMPPHHNPPPVEIPSKRDNRDNRIAREAELLKQLAGRRESRRQVTDDSLSKDIKPSAEVS